VEYSEHYFDWQKGYGAFSAVVDAFKFAPHVRPGDRVLDFGCGGGYLLNHLGCAEKVGVEINPAAQQVARQFGITVYGSVEQVPDHSVDIVISHHALEHVECPLDVLRELLPKLVSGGKAVFVVPHQKPDEAYVENDINQHLYTWNPLTFGNLFKAAGYSDIQADVLRHQWPPHFARLYASAGPRLFHMICWLYAHYTGNYQIRVVARHRG